MATLQSKLKQLRRSEFITCDVRFEVIDGSTTGILMQQESVNGDAAMIGAHKFILALGSPVFKMQFYGHLREDVRRVIRIVDSSPEVFRVFIKCFYEDVDLTQLNINFLCDLYYLGDKYCVEELKDGIILTLASEGPDPADDPFLAVEAAVLGSQAMFPELSEALFKKCVKILQWKFNSFIDDIEWLFDQMRNTYSDDLIDELLEIVRERLELAAVCPNCHKPPSECLNGEGLTADNWVSGARVRMSHVRFSLGGSRETVTLGNPAVHRLGSLNPDMTFTSFSSSGLPLSVATLHPCMYLYNC